MENKFCIGIPTLNRFDLLHPSLMFYVRDFHNIQIHVIDNGQQGISSKVNHPNIIVHDMDRNLGVASSWNMLCDIIFKEHDYALILNDDIYLGRKDWEVDNLISNYKSDLYCSLQEWSAFILPKKTFKQVGRFDEDFYPAYYEDNDYEYRMKLMGKKIFQIPFLNSFVYQSSKTIEKDPTLKKYIEDNKQHYIDKWGGLPKKETYKTPLNQ